MQRNIILTGDGSHSIKIPELNVTYHSIHGAIQESKHVFIDAGFYAPGYLNRPNLIHIFEVGFGTGLNALLTLIEARKLNQKIYYETIEPFPLAIEQIKSLNYWEHLLLKDLQTTFLRFHTCDWEKEVTIESNFILKKRKANLLNVELSETSPAVQQAFELIYFDAFDPSVQPELWTEDIFQKMSSMLRPDGILVTYSSKGTVRRAMQVAGFEVEKIPGPIGKREMVRGRKVI